MAIQSATLISSNVYQVTYVDGGITFVPVNQQNRDYVAVQAWVAAGGVIQ